MRDVTLLLLLLFYANTEPTAAVFHIGTRVMIQLWSPGTMVNAGAGM
jgi:hypothetical protein